MTMAAIRCGILACASVAVAGCQSTVSSPSPTSDFLNQVESMRGKAEAEKVAATLAIHYAEEAARDPRNRLPVFSGPWSYQERELLFVLKTYPATASAIDLSELPWIAREIGRP